MKKLMMLGAIFLVSGLAQAGAVPEFVNYQGRLTDDAGDALATGDYKLKFEVHSDPNADTRVWGPLCFDLDTGGTPTDGHKFKTPVVQGYFNVVLDKDTGYTDCSTDAYEGPPAPITDAFLDSPRYVEVAVWDEGAGDWVAILPRQQVLSAPYAVRADRSREVVSDVAESTRIACQTDPDTTVDVVTVQGAPPAVDVAGDLNVSQSLECDDLTVLGSVIGNLHVNGTADIDEWAVAEMSQDGYAWVGGILLQWGVRTSTLDSEESFDFNIPFPTACFAATFSIMGVGSRSTTQFTVDRLDQLTGEIAFSFIAVGN